MQLSVTLILALTVSVIQLVLLQWYSATALPAPAPAPAPQSWITTTTPAPGPSRMGFRAYLAEFQRINNEVTSAVAKGDHERVRQLSDRLEQLRQQQQREAKEAEQDRRRRQEESDRAEREAQRRQRERQQEEETRNKRKQAEKDKSQSGPTGLYVVIGIVILIGAIFGLVKLCKSKGSETAATAPVTYPRPEPAPVTNTFNYDTTASGGFTLRANDFTYSGPGGTTLSTSPTRGRSPSPRRSPRSSSPRPRPDAATIIRSADESHAHAPSAPLLNPSRHDADAPPGYDEAIRSSPRPVRAQSTEEGPPPFNPEFDTRS